MIGINKATINHGAVSVQLVHLEKELERVGKRVLLSVIYTKMKVLQLIQICHNLRPLLFRHVYIMHNLKIPWPQP